MGQNPEAVVAPAAGPTGIRVIALGAGVGAFATSFWMPFIPLYLKQLGATSDANALAWTSLALTGLGLSRLVAAPVWGVLSDRYGRRVMYVRALVFASATTLIAALATEPWHIVLAFTCQGLLSGFIPAATALTSVSVPESRLGSSLGMVNSGQYLGSMLGPLAGALLAAAFGFRSAILIAAILPVSMAILVLLAVPRDRVAARPARGLLGDAARPRLAVLRSIGELATAPVRIGLLLVFLVYSTSQGIRVAVPLLLAGMAAGAVEETVGIAFAVGGVASVLGVTVAGRYLVGASVLVRGLILTCLVSAGACLLLAVSGSLPAFIAGFALISLTQAAMLPGTNTIVALAAPRDRRGTVFGMVATAQALAFMVGPLAAAAFATVSFALGFALLAVVYVLATGLVYWKLDTPAEALAAT